MNTIHNDAAPPTAGRNSSAGLQQLNGVKNQSSKCTFCFQDKPYHESFFNENTGFCIALKNETENVEDTFESCVELQIQASEFCGCDPIELSKTAVPTLTPSTLQHSQNTSDQLSSSAHDSIQPSFLAPNYGTVITSMFPTLMPSPSRIQNENETAAEIMPPSFGPSFSALPTHNPSSNPTTPTLSISPSIATSSNSPSKSSFFHPSTWPSDISSIHPSTLMPSVSLPPSTLHNSSTEPSINFLSATPSIGITSNSPATSSSFLPSTWLSNSPSHNPMHPSTSAPSSSVPPSMLLPGEQPSLTGNKDQVFRTVACSQNSTLTGYENENSLVMDIFDYGENLNDTLFLCPGTNFTNVGLFLGQSIQSLTLECPSQDCTWWSTMDDGEHHVAIVENASTTTDREISLIGITFQGATNASISITINSNRSRNYASRITFQNCSWINNEGKRTVSIFAGELPSVISQNISPIISTNLTELVQSQPRFGDYFHDAVTELQKGSVNIEEGIEIIFRDCTFINNTAEEAILKYTGEMQQEGLNHYLLSLEMCTFSANEVANGSVIEIDANVLLNAEDTKLIWNRPALSLVYLGENSTFLDSSSGNSLCSSSSNDTKQSSNHNNGINENFKCAGIWLQQMKDCSNVDSCLLESSSPSQSPSKLPSFYSSLAPTLILDVDKSSNEEEEGSPPKQNVWSTESVGSIIGGVFGAIIGILVILGLDGLLFRSWLQRRGLSYQRSLTHYIETKKNTIDNAEENCGFSECLQKDDTEQSEALSSNVEHCDIDNYSVSIAVKPENAGIFIMLCFAIWYSMKRYGLNIYLREKNKTRCIKARKGDMSDASGDFLDGFLDDASSVDTFSGCGSDNDNDDSASDNDV
eukprot:CAMPEP_0178900434 /NCGR_PEP_ID=MMETSP0786-20121207/3473_1 /TAXON_ID=186022 /ORGANISM="Thalassionema frauenfeldii, Strain CCMP 1798" /LENGTH=868 /DNA_ID=CAMNT_0020571441 /DNA_START=242 /DNA_END=2848 /DNA_ORIENTATION=-